VKYKGHDAGWGIQQADEYTAKHYHQPSDEYHPEMDFTGDTAMARFGFALGWEPLPSKADCVAKRGVSLKEAG
jgi:hypothetical protein